MDERRAPGLGSIPCGLDIKNALEDQLAGPKGAHPLDISPVQRRIELAVHPMRQRNHVLHAADVAGKVAECLALALQDGEHPTRFGCHVDEIGETDLGRHSHSVSNIAMALAQDREINGKHKCAASWRSGALDQRLDEAAVAHDVELKPEW